jgi:hypothetical protein
MGLVIRHESLLTFVGRLLRDREFSEWFVASPSQTLASHGLARSDMRDVADVLAHYQKHLRTAQALAPTVDLFLEIIDGEESAATYGEVVDRLDRLEAEMQMTHDRLVAARLEPRVWWKFWQR